MANRLNMPAIWAFEKARPAERIRTNNYEFRRHGYLNLDQNFILFPFDQA